MTFLTSILDWKMIFGSALRISPESIRLYIICAVFFIGHTANAQWTEANNGITGGNVLAIVKSASTLVAATQSGGIYYSSNGGSTWSKGVIDPSNIYCLGVKGTSVIAGTGFGLYRSEDNGANWSQMTTDLPVVTIVSILVDGSTLYIGTTNGAYKSIDDGAHWIEINNTIGTVACRAWTKLGTNLYVGTPNGVYISANGGVDWTAAGTGSPSSNVFALATDGTRIFASSSPSGVDVSSDAGLTWTPANTGLTVYVSALAYNGTGMVGANHLGVYLTTNGGANWNPIGSNWSEVQVDCLLADGSDIYVGTGGLGVYKSTSLGNWSAVNTGMSNVWLNCFASNGSVLMAGSLLAGVFRYNGTSWTQVNNGLVYRNIIDLYFDGTKLFAAAQGAPLYVSTDLGDTWAPSGTGLPGAYVNSVVSDGTKLYAATDGSGVYISTNGGANWAASNTGLTNLTVKSVAVVGSNIYAGTYGGGVFRSTNGGDNWTSVLGGLQVVDLGISGTTIIAATTTTVHTSTNGTAWQTVNGATGFKNIFASGSNAVATGIGGPFLSTSNGTGWISIAGNLSNGVSTAGIFGDKVFVGLVNNGAYVSPLAQLNTSITSFTPASAGAGTVVTLTGTGFDLNPSNYRAYFGPVSILPSASTTSTLNIQVPTGAGYGPITLVNGGRTVTTSRSFVPTFPGSGTMDDDAFLPRVNFTTTAGPISIAVGDYDLDGKADMAVLTLNDGKIEIFRNVSQPASIGTASFTGGLVMTSGNNPRTLVRGDLDGDGLLDLVTANHSTPTSISIFRNLSSGGISFATKFDFNTGALPSADGVAIGDIDKDGKQDIVVSSGTLTTIYRNIGSPGSLSAGSFSQVDLPMDTGPIALADVDGDGYLDIVAGGAGTSVIVAKNISSPGTITPSSFEAPVSFSIPIANWGVQTADLNADGFPEIIAGHTSGTSITVLKNLAQSGVVNSGSFDASFSVAVGLNPRHVALGDLDGDGKPDIAVGNQGSGTVTIIKNTSGGDVNATTLSPVSTITDVPNPLFIAVSDLDRDGKPDLVAASNGTLPCAAILRNAASSPSITSVTPATGAVGSTVTIQGSNFIANTNGNTVYFGATRATVTQASTTELTVTVPPGATMAHPTVTSYGLTATAPEPFIVTYDGGTTQQAAFSNPITFNSGTNAFDFTVCDLDGDGKPDLVAANQGLTVLRNIASAGTISTLSFESNDDFTADSGPRAVRCADLNGDGKKDVIVGNSGLGGTITIHRNQSTAGSFTASSLGSKISLTAGTEASRLFVADLDDDRRPDIVVVNSGANTVSVIRNLVVSTMSASTFAPKVDFETGGIPFDVTVADLNGDNKPEIIVTNSNDQTVSVYKNVSIAGVIDATSFESRVSFTTGTTPTGVGVYDFNGDGRRDIVVANYNQSTVSILENMSTLSTINFASKIDIPAATQPYGLLISDIDGDSKPDILTASSSQTHVAILRNQFTSGSIALNSFAAKVNISSGPAAYSLAVADIDADSRPEIVVANSGTAVFSVMKNNSSLPPSAQPTNLTLTSRTEHTLDISFQAASPAPSGYIVLMSANQAPNIDPQDNTEYTLNQVVGQVSSNDIKVAMLGTETTATLDNLAAGVRYHFKVYSYNGAGSTTNYLTTSPLSGSFITYSDEPTVQAHDIVVSNLSGTSFTVSLGNGGGSSRLVTIRYFNALAPIAPTDGTSYTANAAFGSGDVTGAGNFVVGIGTGPFDLTNLTPATQYEIIVYEFNGADGSENYLTTTPTSNRKTQFTVSAEPTIQASLGAPTNRAETSITLSAIAGNGSSRRIVAKAGSEVDRTPVDGVSYTPSSVFGTNALGNGNFIVNEGPVTGLTAATIYFFRVFEVQGTGGSENYLTTSVAGSEMSATTLSAEPTTQSSSIIITQTTQTAISVQYTNGNGSSRLVLVRSVGTSDIEPPSDGMTYTSNSQFGLGAEVGPEHYAVHKGSGPVVVTGLSPLGTYVVKVYEFNGAGGSENYFNGAGINNPATITLLAEPPVDDTAPEISDYQPASVAPNTAANVSVIIADGQSAISSTSMEYHSVSSSASKTGALTLSSGRYRFQIPSADIGALGAQYRVIAASAGGVKTSPWQTIRLTHTVSNSFSIPYSTHGIEEANYRIISVPLDLTTKTVSSVFDELLPADKKKWRVFRYANSAAAELSGSDLIQPGLGYWLIVRDNIAVTVGGGSTVAATSETPFEIDLVADWNQIGNPYNFNIKWSDVQALNPGLPGLRTFNGDFIDGTQLNKLEGGFVKVTSPQKLKFPVVIDPSINTGRTKEQEQRLMNPLDKPDWQVYFDLTQGARTNRISGFGMNERASDNFDEFDGFNMPRDFFSYYLEVAHHRSIGGHTYSSDVVPPAGTHTWMFDVATSLTGLATLRWDNSYFGDNDFSLVLWDVSRQLAIDMRSTDRYELDPAMSKSFRVYFGSASQIAESTRPRSLVLHSVSPNPSDGDVLVQFSIPENGEVHLEAIDLLGKKVWSSSRHFQRGYHEVTWQAEAELNGVFILRVRNDQSTVASRIRLK